MNGKGDVLVRGYLPKSKIFVLLQQKETLSSTYARESFY